MAVVCLLCGKSFKQLTNTHLGKIHGISRCDYLNLYPDAVMISKDTKTKHSHRSKRFWENLQGENKIQFIKKRADSRRNASPEAKAAFADKWRRAWEGKTELERDRIKQKIKNGHLRLSPGARLLKKIRQNATNAKKTPEEFVEIRRKFKETWNSRTEEQKAETSRKHSEHNRRVHATRTEEQKRELKRKNSESNKATAAARSKEEWAEMCRRNSEAVKRAMAAKSPEELAAWQSKIGKGLNGRPNYPERMLLNWLQPHGFEYVGDGSFWIKDDNGLMNPDFIRKSDSYIVELYGEHFHSEDEWLGRKERLERAGYKATMVWAKELFADSKTIVQAVLTGGLR
ncbi:MAG: hypothetical protein KGL39_00360 [Patescibacteria group bacterium]|nr:hypothetical protein [Patescibacteria group bacterium]